MVEINAEKPNQELYAFEGGIYIKGVSDSAGGRVIIDDDNQRPADCD